MNRMRSQVSRLGTFNGIESRNARSMQFLVDALGERPADAFDLGDFVHTRSDQAAQAAEARQQPAAAFDADPVDRLEHRSAPCAGAPVTMARDGKAMCLVPHLLNEMEPR